MPERFTVVGLGELLWDIFPEGKQLGGAPANFAYMTNLLGDTGVVASRIGDDHLGSEAKQRIRGLGLPTDFIQTDSEHHTGTVAVTVDPSGQPKFQISTNVAWDYFAWTPQWLELAQRADAVCFGSLAQRCAQSRATIRSFLSAVRPGTTRIFDVNLRQKFYSADVLAESIAFAEIIKLNHEELPAVAELLGLPFIYDERRTAEWLREKYNLKVVCITRGAKGSLVVSEQESSEHSGYRVYVADTVGAGDAFTAALTYHYLRHASVATLNEAANRMGAWVASQSGATPPADPVQLERIRSAIGWEE
jgi:fructokinase